MQHGRQTNVRVSFFLSFACNDRWLKAHKEMDRALHESGIYIIVVFSTDTTKNHEQN
jgi:hypothetical protein